MLDSQRLIGNELISPLLFGRLSVAPLYSEPLGHLLRESSDSLALPGLIRNVFVLLWIDLVVVQFDRDDLGVILAIQPAGEAVAVGSHGIAHQSSSIHGAMILTERDWLVSRSRIVENRNQALAFKVLWRLESSQFDKRRVDIDELSQRPCLRAGLLCSGHADDEWSARVVFDVAVLAPTIVFTQLPAVIAPKNDDSVLG